MIKETKENLSKAIWYHGTSLNEKEMKINPPMPDKIFWVTTSKEYAEKFVTQYKGIKFSKVYKILLNDGIEIFDTKNKSDLSKLKWPKYFMFWLEFHDDMLQTCSSVISKKDWDDRYVDFIEKAPHTDIENRKGIYAYHAEISEKEAQRDIDEWDAFAKNKLKLDTFVPSKFKGLHRHDNRPDGYIRTKLCEELLKLGYQAIRSKEYGFETIGIFDIDALKALSAKPIEESKDITKKLMNVLIH